VGGLEVSVFGSKVRSAVVVGKPSKEMELNKFSNIALVACPKGERICLAEGLEVRLESVGEVDESLKGAGES
jgi:hypothetical protein